MTFFQQAVTGCLALIMVTFFLARSLQTRWLKNTLIIGCVVIVAAMMILTFPGL